MAHKAIAELLEDQLPFPSASMPSAEKIPAALVHLMMVSTTCPTWSTGPSATPSPSSLLLANIGLFEIDDLIILSVNFWDIQNSSKDTQVIRLADQGLQRI